VGAIAARLTPEFKRLTFVSRADGLVGKRQVYKVAEYWENPSRLAFRFLEELELDLGPELDGDNVMGKINFYDGLASAGDC